MKRLLLIPVLLLTLLVGNPACSTGFQKGLDAYQRGDYETALRELEPLAEQGNPDAQYNLGWMYYQGEGTAQDYVYAHMWLNICASEGDKNAVKNQERVAMKMTPLQLTNARRLASECIKKNYKGC